MELDAIIEENLVTFDLIFSELKSVNGHSISEIRLTEGYKEGSGEVNVYRVWRDDGRAIGDIRVRNYELTDVEINRIIEYVNADIADSMERWDAKYDKPSTGIPRIDLSSDVRNSLSKADTAVQDISGKADKSSTLSGYGILDAKISNGTITLGNNSIKPLTEHQSLEEYAKKSEITSVYKMKGSCYYSDLPIDPEVGDVWNIIDEVDGVSGSNYVWTGTVWSKLGGTMNLDDYVTYDQVKEAFDGVDKDLLGKVDQTAYDIEIEGLKGLIQNAKPDGYEDLKANVKSNTDDIEDLINDKADKSTTYTKTETNDLLNEKANATSVSDYLGVDITKKRNLANEFTNGNFSDETGSVGINTIRILSDFIRVENGKTYTITVPSGYYVWEVFGYASIGAGGSKIKATSSVSTYQFTATTSYIRFTVRRSDNGTISPTEANVMFCEGTTGTYVPYVRPLSEVRPHSNRNLLDNPWFTVNQRGWTSGDLEGGKFCVDRWKFSSSSGNFLHVEKTTNGLVLRNDDSVARFLVEGLESDVANYLKGKAVTLSMMNENGVVSSGTIVFPSSGYYDVAVFSTEFRVSSTGAINIRVNAGQTLQIRAVKLELGDKSTLAYDSAPNYTEELLKCQRYYWKPSNGSVPYRSYSNSNSSNIHVIELVFPTEMRAIPTFDYTTDADKANMYSQVSKVGFSLYSFLYPNSFVIRSFEATADL